MIFIFYSYICLNICDNYHQPMKTKKEYVQLIREYLDSTAQKYGVTRMALFGSVARDEQMDDSDIDIAYEGQANIFIRIRMKTELEKYDKYIIRYRSGKRYNLCLISYASNLFYKE